MFESIKAGINSIAEKAVELKNEVGEMASEAIDEAV